MGSGTRHALEAFCTKQGITLTQAMELGSNAAVKHAVLAGLGVAVMPRLSVQLELNNGLLHQLVMERFPLCQSWHTVYPRNKHLTPAAEAFMSYIELNMDAIKEHFENLYQS